MWRTRTAVVSAVKTAFDEEGIKIPFPQRELMGREEAGGLQLGDGATLTGREERVAAEADGGRTDADGDRGTTDSDGDGGETDIGDDSDTEGNEDGDGDGDGDGGGDRS
jgi:hypothetical protein